MEDIAISTLLSLRALTLGEAIHHEEKEVHTGKNEGFLPTANTNVPAT